MSWFVDCGGWVTVRGSLSRGDGVCHRAERVRAASIASGHRCSLIGTRGFMEAYTTVLGVGVHATPAFLSLSRITIYTLPRPCLRDNSNPPREPQVHLGHTDIRNGR